jgi:glycosyltransferase involved in cell wall biosynthesis
VDITVILCTYNRSEALTKALDSVVASVLPDALVWEILVIDNNSSDGTREVVEDSCRRHPGRLRYLFESQQGKSHALNVAVRAACGDILAFMDDDVTVEPTWLQNLTAPLRSGEWAGAGGRILAERDFSPPRWLALDGPYSLGAMLYAQFDLGDKVRKLHRPPYGTNMAFRREMFTRYGGFRTDLGPRPGSEIRCEDTEFGNRLLAAGERLRYEPTAVVYHSVPHDRVRREFFLAWWFDYGRAAIRIVGTRPDVLGVPRYYFSIPKGILTTLIVALNWMLALNPKRRFFLKGRVYYLTGQIGEIYRNARCKIRDEDGVVL